MREISAGDRIRTNRPDASLLAATCCGARGALSEARLRVRIENRRSTIGGLLVPQRSCSLSAEPGASGANARGAAAVSSPVSATARRNRRGRSSARQRNGYALPAPVGVRPLLAPLGVRSPRNQPRLQAPSSPEPRMGCPARHMHVRSAGTFRASRWSAPHRCCCTDRSARSSRLRSMRRAGNRC